MSTLLSLVLAGLCIIIGAGVLKNAEKIAEILRKCQCCKTKCCTEDGSCKEDCTVIDVEQLKKELKRDKPRGSFQRKKDV